MVSLRNLFKKIHFKVKVYNNKTAAVRHCLIQTLILYNKTFDYDQCIIFMMQEIKDILPKESVHKDHSNADCFALIILSHGDEGVVKGVDGKQVEISWIKTCFDGYFCPKLAGKPKLLIIQACQGCKS